jgi:hypothetical protein
LVTSYTRIMMLALSICTSVFCSSFWDAEESIN